MPSRLELLEKHMWDSHEAFLDWQSEVFSQCEEVVIPMSDFTVKDGGERMQFASGMLRDTASDKVRYDLVFDGPLMERLAVHLTKGALKYAPRNWMKAAGIEELERFKQSALRHMFQWLRGDMDEDHFAAVVFNMNGYEYVRDKLAQEKGGTQ
jgi:hypothetical protein